MHPAPASRMLLQGLPDPTAAPAARSWHPEADLSYGDVLLLGPTRVVVGSQPRRDRGEVWLCGHVLLMSALDPDADRRRRAPVGDFALAKAYFDPVSGRSPGGMRGKDVSHQPIVPASTAAPLRSLDCSRRQRSPVRLTKPWPLTLDPGVATVGSGQRPLQLERFRPRSRPLTPRGARGLRTDRGRQPSPGRLTVPPAPADDLLR
jgi:hypothetical protein